ncbi:asparaginase [Coriobacterium glomerans]|nr:asparaginase [Coriobacterium glomerans]
MKHILLVATGGTIASTEAGRGLSPALTGEELARAVPEIAALCDIEIMQPMNIDSTNMLPVNWLRIRDIIVERYDAFDGFVILHGTDTMAYTAAALSYLIQQSPKPIVITGSQRPMGSSFTDAKLNLYQSLRFATDARSHDVTIVFGGIAIAGTRARKQRTMSSNAFTSVNYPPLAIIRNDRVIRTDCAEMMSAQFSSTVHAALDYARAERASVKDLRPEDLAAAGPIAQSSRKRSGKAGALGIEQPRAPHTYEGLDERVFVLKLTPGLKPSIFETLRPSYDAVILETFGLGGIPSHEERSRSFQHAIFDWVDSGRTIVITTQVPEEGLDLGVYEISRPYAEHPGILRGDDMTTEALVAKTMWALGQSHDPDVVRTLFYLPVNHDRLVIA